MISWKELRVKTEAKLCKRKQKEENAKTTRDDKEHRRLSMGRGGYFNAETERTESSASSLAAVIRYPKPLPPPHSS